MIGTNIKRLRLQNGMTQKNLADKLFVSAQAVSRWENGEVEPSITTVMELSKIFGVSTDEILGVEAQETTNNDTQDNYQREESYRQILTLCEQCNRPIYDSDEIIRENKTVFCRECYEKNEEKRRENEKRERRKIIASAQKRRKRSFIFGSIPAIFIFSLLFIGIFTEGYSDFSDFLQTMLGGIEVSLPLFTFISCILLNNNFVAYMFLRIATWSIKMPGLIFTFDLDGCLWFLAMKLIFAVLGFIFGIIMVVLAFIISVVVSIFVYPYAIMTNIKHPEKTYL